MVVLLHSLYHNFDKERLSKRIFEDYQRSILIKATKLEKISNDLNRKIDDLKYSDESIVDIALNNGFPNIQAFNRTFKELFQMTPKQYRKKTRK